MARAKLRFRELVNCHRDGLARLAFGANVPADCVAEARSEWEVMCRDHHGPIQAKIETLAQARREIATKTDMPANTEALADDDFMNFVFAGEHNSRSRFDGNLEAHALYKARAEFLVAIQLYAPETEKAYLRRCLDCVIEFQSLEDRADRLAARIENRDAAMHASEDRLAQRERAERRHLDAIIYPRR